LASYGSRSIRAASIACTVERIQGLGQFRDSVARQYAFFEEPLHNLFDEEGITLRLLRDQCFERFQTCIVAEQDGQQSLGALGAERVEAQLSVVAFVGPRVRILRAVIHKYQNAGCSYRVGEQIEHRLSFGVDPMQVLENQHQGLVEGFAEQNALDCVERAPAPYLHIHLRQGVLGLRLVQVFIQTVETYLPMSAQGDVVRNSQQSKYVRPGIFERCVQNREPTRNFFTPAPFVVALAELEVVGQQLDQRQKRARLAVRHRIGLQYHPVRRGPGLEFMEKPRLADARFRDGRDDLSMPLGRERRRAPDRLHLMVPPDQARKPASCRALQPRTQRPEPGDLVHVDRLADSLDGRGPARLERKISLHQAPRMLRDRDRAGRRHGLHPRGEVRGVPDRRVLDIAATG